MFTTRRLSRGGAEVSSLFSRKNYRQRRAHKTTGYLEVRARADYVIWPRGGVFPGVAFPFCLKTPLQDFDLPAEGRLRLKTVLFHRFLRLFVTLLFIRGAIMVALKYETRKIREKLGRSA